MALIYESKVFFFLIIVSYLITNGVDSKSTNINVCYDDASFYMTLTCEGAFATITGDPGGVFSFNPEPSDDAVIDSNTGTVANGTPGVTYFVQYTNPTADMWLQEITIPFPDDASFFMTPTCDGATATVIGTLGGTFNFNPTPPDGAAIDPVTGTVTGCVFGNLYSVEYTTFGPCPNSSIESFFAGCNGIIEVNAFIDENTNGIFDASEMIFNQGEFTYELNNDGIINYVNSYYESLLIPVIEADDTFDIGFEMNNSYNSCLNQTITLIENVTVPIAETIQIDFPINQIDLCNDIAVYIISFRPPRPGLIYENRLVVINLGDESISGSVEFTHDSSLSILHVLDIDEGNSITNTTTGFILNFNDLQYGEFEAVTASLDVPLGAMAGDLLTNSAVYSGSDLNLDNNEFVLTEVVVNSWDPNDKMESHGPEIKFEDFTDNDFLFYTIRFQNLGTAEAIDIRIEDVLDTQLDASTFKMLHASHDYVVTRTNNNLVWEFEGIDLPSESMDEPNSHGYVYFKIRPNSGFTIGDIIPNYADIYFDFNPAVTTNIFETEFVEFLSVDEFYSTAFSMYPNPAHSFVIVELNSNVNEAINITIYDIQGKLVFMEITQLENNKIQFDVSSLSQGMYFVELKGENYKTVKKIIKE